MAPMPSNAPDWLAAQTVVKCKTAGMGRALVIPELEKVKAESARTPSVTGGRAVKQHVFTAVIWCGLISEKPHQTAHAFMNYPSRFLCRLHFPLTCSRTPTEEERRRILKLITC